MKRHKKDTDPRQLIFAKEKDHPFPKLLLVAPSVEAAKYVLLGLEIGAQYQADYDGLSGLDFFDGSSADVPTGVVRGKS